MTRRQALRIAEIIVAIARSKAAVSVETVIPLALSASLDVIASTASWLVRTVAERIAGSEAGAADILDSIVVCTAVPELPDPGSFLKACRDADGIEVAAGWLQHRWHTAAVVDVVSAAADVLVALEERSGDPGLLNRLAWDLIVAGDKEAQHA